MALRVGLHTSNVSTKEATATLSKSLKDTSAGLHSATRVHEAGITSNRGSACTVNAFPGLVHTARHTMGVGSTLRQGFIPLTTYSQRLG